MLQTILVLFLSKLESPHKNKVILLFSIIKLNIIANKFFTIHKIQGKTDDRAEGSEMYTLFLDCRKIIDSYIIEKYD